MLNNEPNDYNSNEEDAIDIKSLLNKIAFHWRLFSLTIPLALVVAYFMNRYSDPVYRMNTTVLISVEEPSFNGLDGLMASYGMSSSKNAHYNELELMKSKGLTETVVEELGFELSYFAEGVIRLSEIYNDSPFYVEYDNSHNQLINVFFNITLDGSNSFKITNDITLADKTYNYSDKKYTPSLLQPNLDSSFKYGEWIESENYRFRVFKKSDNQLTHKSPTSSFKFIFNSYDELINKYNKAVSYNPIKESSVLELSIEGPHKGKLIDFLNTLTSNYISNGLSYKNSIADNTIGFIETQLALIGDTLETSERELEDFRSEIGIMDIGIESSQSSERFVALDDQSAKIRLELKYYKDLLVYLQDNEINSIISPSVAGIKDPILLSLVSNLQELNLTRSRLNYSMESQNPVITQVQIEIDQTIGALVANVKNLISTTELQDKDLNSRILVMEDMFSSLPASERQMLTIQREYGIHDKMFTFLLEKRVEAGITKAAN